MLNRTSSNNAFFRQFLFLVTLIAIGLIIFNQLRSLLGAFLGAITLYVVLRGPFFTLTEKYKWKPWITSLALVSVMTVILLGIGFLVFEVTASEIPNVDTSKLVVWMNGIVDKVNSELGFKVLSENILSKSSDVLEKAVQAVLSTTYSFAVNVFLMLVVLYFMFVNARKMEAKILEYQPFKGLNLEMIKNEFRNMIFSNAVGIPMVMFGQALAAWIVYMAFGIENAIFWAFLTALCGLVPMVGTVLVSAPMGIYMMSEGNILQGILMICCGVLIIANVDNLIRILLLQKQANTHPLVVIFGVILGIPLFGFWGIIFGPLFISSFLLLMKIYYSEYDLTKDKTMVETSDKKNESVDKPD